MTRAGQETPRSRLPETHPCHLAFSGLGATGSLRRQGCGGPASWSGWEAATHDRPCSGPPTGPPAERTGGSAVTVPAGRRVDASAARAASIASATSSSWSFSRWPYRSRVIVAGWWPSTVCTTVTFEPPAMASEAAVCRSACEVSPSRPAARAAGSKPIRRKPRRCRPPPFSAAKTKSPGCLSARGRGAGRRPGRPRRPSRTWPGRSAAAQRRVPRRPYGRRPDPGSRR